jgi:hypothetical protein
MAVNVSKTNYIIFHPRGKQENFFNSNDTDVTTPDPTLAQRIE